MRYPMPTAMTTANGICILVEELPHTHSVSLGCFVGVGARHETARQSGAAHFIEHMLFKGSRDFPSARLISETIERLGGVLNASTGYESTVYWGKVADIHFDRLLHLLADMVCRPLFEARDVEKERKVIIEEIRGLQDTPSEWIHELLQTMMWGDQPLGRDIAGSVETVSALCRNELHGFWQRSYGASNTVISVAGNIAADDVAERVARAFAAYPAGAQTTLSPVGILRAGPQLVMQSRETEQGNFCIGFPGLSYNDRDRRALQVLDTILGGGMSSRLFQVLREDNGMGYSVGSYHESYLDTGTWVIYGSVETEALRDAIALALDIMGDLARAGVTEEELNLVKEQVKGGILLALEDTWAVASRNGSHQLRYGSVIPVEQVVAEVEAVTATDVQRVARSLIRADACHIAVVGPYEEDDRCELEELIEQELEN